MIVLRSLLFNVLFVLANIAWFVLALPLLALPRAKVIRYVSKPWCRTLLWLHRVVCGVTVEVRGREKIPPSGLLVACKHASAWETLGLFIEFEEGAYILKRELLAIPLFGLYLTRAGQIAINRGNSGEARAKLAADARAAIAEGRQVLIFPEGTRRAVDAPPAYRQGIGYLYELSGATCVPVAHNAGLFWPRRSFMKYPGHLVLEILDPIPPGLAREAFMARLQDTIETATNRLVAEARARGEGMREGEGPPARNGPPKQSGVPGRETLPPQAASLPSDATPSSATSRASVRSATPSADRLS